MVDYSQFEASVKSGIHADVSRIRQKDEIIKAVVKKRRNSAIICVCFLCMAGISLFKSWIPAVICFLLALFFLWRAVRKFSDEYLREMYEEGLLKDKPVKYWIQTEIEEIIKEKSVDREWFYEYSKTSYQKIIKCMLAKIKERLSYDWNKKIYLILSDGWVYEGYIDTMIDVLNEVDGLLEDFYIVTPQFDKFAAYTDDGQCLCFYEK
ncbi:hypothetical protein [Petralouisia muris]|uniref:hypothetical protein n=1 Tax=Petralouisia muris TaxID=3032872 RepID=UPI0023B8496B|nr:hypothetical protein [Petralouisia muris]